MHDDDDVADDVFTSVCSHSYLHLGISCLFGAKTHEIMSTVAQISPLQRNKLQQAGSQEDACGDALVRLRLQSLYTSQELNSTNPLCSSHRPHHEAEAAGGGEDVQGADR